MSTKCFGIRFAQNLLECAAFGVWRFQKFQFVFALGGQMSILVSKAGWEVPLGDKESICITSQAIAGESVLEGPGAPIISRNHGCALWCSLQVPKRVASCD